MVNLIDEMIMDRNVQREIDNVYSQFCIILRSEMDQYLKYTSSSRPLRTRLKSIKIYNGK